MLIILNKCPKTRSQSWLGNYNISAVKRSVALTKYQMPQEENSLLKNSQKSSKSVSRLLKISAIIVIIVIIITILYNWHLKGKSEDKTNNDKLQLNHWARIIKINKNKTEHKTTKIHKKSPPQRPSRFHESLRQSIYFN